MYKQNLFLALKTWSAFFIHISFCTWSSPIEDNYPFIDKSCLHIFSISISADYEIDHMTYHVSFFFSTYAEQIFLLSY